MSIHGVFFYVQLTFTCSKSAIETLEKGVKYVQSQESPTVTYILTKEPSRKNIFQQSFGRDTQPEKCLKIAIFTAISDVLFLIIRLFPLYFNV